MELTKLLMCFLYIDLSISIPVWSNMKEDPKIKIMPGDLKFKPERTIAKKIFDMGGGDVDDRTIFVDDNDDLLRVDSHHNSDSEIQSTQDNSSTAGSSTHVMSIQNNLNQYDIHTNTVYNQEKPKIKRLPQALIIGVKKSGTRALLEFLKIHPQIKAPGPEPHFFDKFYSRGFDWYRNQMPETAENEITIEKTPCYYVTKEAPKRIYDMNKNVKLIVVVRDPVTRAISDYTQAATKRQMKSFEEMVLIDNTSRIVDTKWAAVRIGVYAKYLEKWLKYFPLNQIYFVNGEKLISDPAEEMNKVQDFLGVERLVTRRHFSFKDSWGFPCLKKSAGSKHPHCLRKNKGRQHPYVKPEVLHRLREFYKPFNLKFYQMTGIDFGWS